MADGHGCDLFKKIEKNGNIKLSFGICLRHKYFSSAVVVLKIKFKF